MTITSWKYGISVYCQVQQKYACVLGKIWRVILQQHLKEQRGSGTDQPLATNFRC